MRIRPEEPGDAERIHEIHRAAFDGPDEAELVEALRVAGVPLVSLVAETGDEVVGHILFSPVTLPGGSGTRTLGLAPMAVLPAWQRRGVGSELVRRGLEACRAAGCSAVVVLGHPAYYPRFGFVPASRFGLACRWEVPDEAFLAFELVEGALAGCAGSVRYHSLFDRF